MKKPLTLLERLWAKVDIRGPNDCWPWEGATDKYGYGLIGEGAPSRKLLQVHRVTFESKNGPIPKGLLVMHSCDNPGCCNPAHLAAGTHQQNMDDRDRKGRNAKGEKVNSAKLTAAQITAIIADPRRQIDIAAEYGVAQGHVSHIKRGNVWKHLKP